MTIGSPYRLHKRPSTLSNPGFAIAGCRSTPRRGLHTGRGATRWLPLRLVKFPRAVRRLQVWPVRRPTFRRRVQVKPRLRAPRKTDAATDNQAGSRRPHQRRLRGEFFRPGTPPNLLPQVAETQHIPVTEGTEGPR